MSSNMFSSMVSSLSVSVNDDDGSVVCVAQGAVTNDIFLISTTATKDDKDSDSDGIDDDKDVVSQVIICIEDDNGNTEDKNIVSVIPKEEIRKGSVLDFDFRLTKNQKQSVNIIRKGKEKVKKNISQWNCGKNVKSSGYGKDVSKVKMFEPVINKRVKKTSLPLPEPGRLSRRSAASEPDLSGDRARWSLGERSGAEGGAGQPGLLVRTAPLYPLHLPPPREARSRVRIWDTEGTRSQVTFSGSGKCLAVSGANNSVQVLHRWGGWVLLDIIVNFLTLT